jgi:hypothetical protein
MLTRRRLVRKIVGAMLLFAGLATGGRVLAAPSPAPTPPQTLLQQGRLFNTDGTPALGPLAISFAIYDSAAATSPVWTETQAVAIDGGYFAVQLGKVTAFSTSAALLADLVAGTTLYIGITVGGDTEMTPREELTSVPYALFAGDAIGDIHPNSVSINGHVVIKPDGSLVGVAGATGPTGLKGPTGAVGLTGAVGATGTVGVVGAVGPTGVIGPTGTNSSTAGLKGPTGAVGDVSTLIGPTGPTGPAGANSAVQGPIGPTGGPGAASAVPGPTGPTGAAGSNSTTPGPTGPIGATGPSITANGGFALGSTVAAPAAGASFFNYPMLAVNTKSGACVVVASVSLLTPGAHNDSVNVAYRANGTVTNQQLNDAAYVGAPTTSGYTSGTAAGVVNLPASASYDFGCESYLSVSPSDYWCTVSVQCF